MSGSNPDELTVSLPQNRKPEQHKDEEEGISRYQPGGFHPVHINEIFNNQYIVGNPIVLVEFWYHTFNATTSTSSFKTILKKSHVQNFQSTGGNLNNFQKKKLTIT